MDLYRYKYYKYKSKYSKILNQLGRGICEICKEDVPDINMELHKIRCKVVICPTCNMSVRDDRLKRHSQGHELVKCKDCNKDFEKCQIDHHVDECMKRFVSCSECSEQCRADELLQHECNTDCPFCEKTVKISRLDDHLKECKVRCEQCQNEVLTTEMDRHLELDCPLVAQRTQKCHKCKNYVPIIKMIRGEHECVQRQQVKEQDRDVRKCPTCGYGPFDDPSNLTVHRMQIHNYEPVICPRCSGQFDSEDDLILHQEWSGMCQ